MSITILTNQRDPVVWQKALQAKLPTTKIMIFGIEEMATKAPFLLCWKPKKDQLEVFSQLKVVQSLGAGVDHIFATNELSNKVKVVRIVDERLTVDMWEYCLAATMAFLRDQRQYYRQESYQYWRPRRYKTIADTTISILGLGQIGAYVAERFAQLGFKVQGWANSPKKIADVHTFVGNAELPKLLQKTDVLINLLPLTDSTAGILNRKILSQLNRGAYLVNVGRGGHLVETELIPLIDSGQLSGATLDVFVTEPLPSQHPFWRHPKIQITPHVASLTNKESVIGQIVENYQRMVEGRNLLHEVSLRKGY